jgi:threonyl-tRNA synthetase
MAPVQVKVLPIIDKQQEYADNIAAQLRKFGVRVEVDNRNEKIGYKIREAQLEKVPYMLVIGDRERENNLVAVRSRKEGDLGAIDVDTFIQKLVDEIATKAR